MHECWLCLYNHTEEAKNLMAFIHENIGSASADSLAAQVSAELCSKYPCVPGIGVQECKAHIESHTLHPVCRVGTMLRNLLSLSEDLEKGMRMKDENGFPVLDLKLTRAYIEVQSQIMTIYKSGDQKLMFH